jgi:CBS domain-containing protein
MISTKAEQPILASSVMQRRPISLLPSDTIQYAVDALSENHISAAPIVNEEGELVGMFTLHDLLRLVQSSEQSTEGHLPLQGNRFLLTKLIQDILGNDDISTAMSGSPITARQDDPLSRIAQLMLNHQVHHIPVVNEHKQLVGMISSIDFVRLAVDAAAG